MQDEEPVLPEWVQTLIEAEKDKAYYRGRDDGYRFAIETMQRKLNDLGASP